GIQLGTINGAILSDGVINTVNPMPMTEMGNVPFLIKSCEAYYDMLDDFYADVVNEESKKRGFVNVAYYLAGGVDVGNIKRPISTPEDLVGLKIRTWDAQGPLTFLSTLKAVPITMAFGEVYTSLQQGAIDGVITSDFQFNAQKFTDIVKYHTQFHVFYNYQNLTFGAKWFDSLPKDVQSAFIEAGNRSQKYCREVITPAFAESTYKDMEKAGVKVTYLTDEQKQVFADAVSGTWPKFRERIGAEIFDEVAAYMEAWKE
ncbi:MAG TPA: TRAP transporter substrate-binding protein, partial [Anaerovoracaceae bacterium]|nr:TRAP transporter substrate-binding protein [Anaerovoracaceae bacterium]